MRRRRPVPLLLLGALLMLQAPLTAACGSAVAPVVRSKASVCPSRWDVGVVWSSVAASPSRIDYLSSGHLVASDDLEGMGLGRAPRDTVARTSWGAALGLMGNQWGGTPRLAAFDSATCTTTTLPRPVAGLIDVDATDSSFVTLEGHNAIRTVNPRSDARREGAIAGPVLRHVTQADGRVYAIGDVDRAELVVVQARDVYQLRRIPLPGVALVGGRPLVSGGKLYYPQTLMTDGGPPGRAIGVVDLSTFEHSTIPLDAPLPYLLQVVGDTLYVGHTYSDATQGPLSSHRTLSIVDLRTGHVTTHQVGIGITQFAVRGSTLHVLGISSSGRHEHEAYRAYDLRTFAQLTAAELTPPPGPGYYEAGLVLPAAPGAEPLGR